ncbi:hypothetical protein PG993_009024 [Apiospora rasikravindrae]|uniref:DUF7918 domain-containing protein n=1 Tax=Apiospora rasikravindrae TaxID=990691 RepID=A0ABR1SIC0_9PEZI
MAVIDELEGLEAWVEINGERAQEYAKPDGSQDARDLKNTPHTIKYIEAVPNEKFSVVFKKARGFTRNCNHLGVRYAIDQNETIVYHESFQDKKDRRKEWVRRIESFMSGSQEKGWVEHYFKFSDVKYAEESASSNELLQEAERNMKLYGRIRVKCYRMAASELVEQELKPIEAPECLAEEVPKEVWKGNVVTSRSNFSTSPLGYQPRSFLEQEEIFIDPLKRPFAVFEFRYRSRGVYNMIDRLSSWLTNGSEGLYQEGILKRPHAVDNMSQDELRRLARLYMDQENDAQPKREADQAIKNEDDGAAPNLKRSALSATEAPRKRYKETVRGDGKVEIDLD